MGEVLFDLIFINYLLMKGKKVYLCAKNNFVLNDVTIEHLNIIFKDKRWEGFQKFLISKQLNIIDNGSDTLGKVWTSVSHDYRDAFKSCDLIIMKGQANFHTTPLGFNSGRFHNKYVYKKKIFFYVCTKILLNNGLC